MTDGIIKGTGNSRLMRSVPDILTRYPTYESFAAALRDGTFPFDLNGINELGWDVIGTQLNAAFFQGVKRMEQGSFVSPGYTQELHFNSNPSALFISGTNSNANYKLFVAAVKPTAFLVGLYQNVPSSLISPLSMNLSWGGNKINITGSSLSFPSQMTMNYLAVCE